MAFPSLTKSAAPTAIPIQHTHRELPLSENQDNNGNYWDLFIDPSISTWKRLVGGAAPGLIGAAFLVAPFATAAAVLLAACIRSDSSQPVKKEKISSGSLKEDPRPALVSVESDVGQGTGFFVKHNGVPLIVTARHNVAFTQRFWVARFEGSREKTITVIHPNVRVLAWDRKNDLAVLEVENLRDGVDALELADTIPARNTELMAWGTPSIPTLSGEPLRMIPAKVGLHDVREEGTMDLWTEKITSQFGRAKWLYLDGKILPGNSGGPVLDTKTGRVVGVISMGARGMNEGIATPAEAVARLLEQIPTPAPLTNAKAEAAIGHLLEAFLPLSDPGPDVERFVAPRELGQLVGKRIGMWRQMAETVALCDMREQNSSSPNKNPWMEEACRFFQHVDENPKAKAALQECVKDIPSCARSTLSDEIQKSFRTQFRYQQGKLFKEVKVIEEPVQDANPRLWHVKARWLIGDETATERLLLEEAHGEVFVRLFEEDGTPVVKVEEKPAAPAPKAKQKERPSNADPYGGRFH